MTGNLCWLPSLQSPFATQIATRGASVLLQYSCLNLVPSQSRSARGVAVIYGIEVEPGMSRSRIRIKKDAGKKNRKQRFARNM